MSLGERIKAARKALNLSQDDLAEAIGANRVTISKYENGKFLPSVTALEKLADVLQLSPSELTGRIETEGEALIPRTDEARILAKGIDKLPKEQREQALSVIKAMFAKYEDYFEKENDDET